MAGGGVGGSHQQLFSGCFGFMVPSAIPRTVVQNPEFIFMPIVHLFTTTRVSFSPKPYGQRNR